jgi:CHASE1-domain containing sensor protein
MQEIAAARVMMFSHPMRRAAISWARDSGETAPLLGKVKLADETSENAQADVPMYIRYYRRTGIPDTLDKKRSSLVGYVYAPFRFDDFIQAILCRIGRP